MNKSKYITVENYKQFKPSEFIRSFISDIEVAEKIGKPMNMMLYGGYYDGCLPCLGGMACMNMGINPEGRTSVEYFTSRLGNEIRRGDNPYRIIDCINGLYDIDIRPDFTFKTRMFLGELHLKRQFTPLKKQVEKYANAYEKIGY